MLSITGRWESQDCCWNLRYRLIIHSVKDDLRVELCAANLSCYSSSSSAVCARSQFSLIAVGLQFSFNWMRLGCGSVLPDCSSNLPDCGWVAVQFTLIAVGLQFSLPWLLLCCSSVLPDCGWVAVQIYRIAVQNYLIAVGLQFGCGSELPDCGSVATQI